MLYLVLFFSFFSCVMYASEQENVPWTESCVARVFAGGDLHIPRVESQVSSIQSIPQYSPSVSGCPAFPAVSSGSLSVSPYNQPVSAEEAEPTLRSESTMTQVGSPTDLPRVTVRSPKDNRADVDFVRVFAARGKRALQSPIVHVVPGFPSSNAALPVTESSASRRVQHERRVEHKKNEIQFLGAVDSAFNDATLVESRSNSSSEIASQQPVSDDLVQSPNNHVESAFPTTRDQQSGVSNVESSSKKSPRHADEQSIPGLVQEQVTHNVSQPAGSVRQSLNPVPQEYGHGCLAGLLRCLRGQSDTQSE